MSDPSSAPDDSKIQRVSTHLKSLQDEICAALEARESQARFRRDEITREGGGLSRPRVLEGGGVIEKAAVNFTHTLGHRMPPAATNRRPELAGGTYQAASISLIVHPQNPYAPTSHANFRCFFAQPPAKAQTNQPTWWFGGGFDLTPYYGFEEDAIFWHQTARNACATFGEDLYPRFKRACDEYFFLPHRQEPRGIGGLFFDDFDEGGFDSAFSFVRQVSTAYLEAYLPILDKRKNLPYGEREREFQLYRRGRYVEFNLLQDRGTLFGLQAATRVESVLASMPPMVSWRYDWHPEPGTPEAVLYADFLRPRDWASESL
ncbi:oxygen-dependent coproporphyrinogen oxidase [Myxococcota bacterium]|nr:oxygen-dependent coproporphyrinogen oxidase [Myxococcota bacterium]